MDNYPDSIYHSRSLAALKKMPAATARTKPVQPKPKPATPAPQADAIANIIDDASPPTKNGQTETASAPGTAVMVNGLRFWSNPSYTRIVVDANQETSFTHRLLKKDPTIQKPQRLYIDLRQSRLVRRQLSTRICGDRFFCQHLFYRRLISRYSSLFLLR